MRLGLAARPALAEDVIVARDLLIAADAGKPWHIAHVSTATRSSWSAGRARAACAVTCEVTPHHLLLLDDASTLPRRRQGESAAARQARPRGLARRRARRHDRRRSRPTTRRTGARRRRSSIAAPVGFSGLEIAVGAYALGVPELPLSASSSCSRRTPRAFSASRAARSRRRAGRRDGVRRPPWTVDARAVPLQGQEHAVRRHGAAAPRASRRSSTARSCSSTATSSRAKSSPYVAKA